jgi:hypothetical protein
MSDQYVSRVSVVINGKPMEDFKTFKDNSRELRVSVNLMTKTGFVKKTVRYGFSIDYVVPVLGSEFDFDSLENARVQITLDDGNTIVYSGVVTKSVGDATADGDKEMTRTIEFGASERTVA